MTTQEAIAKMREITSRRGQALDRLVEPARAAANQMKDAGMGAGSDPLLAVLFELDAIQAEMRQLPGEVGVDVFFEALMEMMGRAK